MDSSFTSWIRSELAKAFPRSDLTQGVDLNDNGRLEENERIDFFDKNGTVGDAADWRAFLKGNEPFLRPLGGPFQWGAFLKADNPIHDLFSLESRLENPDDIRKAYEQIQSLLEEVKGRLMKEQPSTPKEKMKVIYDVLAQSGYTYIERKDSSLTQALREKCLDCDGSSFITLAIAHELDWPVGVVLPNYKHMFNRWTNSEDPSDFFNMDVGKSLPNSSYKQSFPTSSELIEKGIYLKTLDEKGVLSIFLYNHSCELNRRARYQEAAAFLDQAILLSPETPVFFAKRGLNKAALGDQEALADLDRAIELDPSDASWYNNRGKAKHKLGDLPGSLQDYERALAIEPMDHIILNNCALLKADMGDFKGSFENFQRAIFLKPGVTEVMINRASIYLKLRKMREARRDVEDAVAIDPNETNLLSLNILRFLNPERVDLGVSARLRRSGGERHIDGRLYLGWLMNLQRITTDSSLGARLEAGYGRDGSHDSVDVSVEPTWLYYPVDSETLDLGLGIGYNFLLSGDSKSAVLEEGAFLRYGLRFTGTLDSPWKLGGTVYAQQSIPDFGPPAVGVGFYLSY